MVVPFLGVVARRLGASPLLVSLGGSRSRNELATPVYAATFQLLFPAEHRGTLMGPVRTAMSGASILGSLLAGPGLERFGYRVVFPVAALFGTSGALPYLRLRPPRTSPVLRRPTGILASASSAASVAGYFLWGRVIDRTSGVATLRSVLIVSAITPLLYAAAPSPWAALLPAAIDGFLIAAVELGWMATVMKLAPPPLVVHYAGAYTSLIGVRGVFVPPDRGSAHRVPRPAAGPPDRRGLDGGRGAVAWRRLNPRYGAGARTWD